VLFSAPMPRSLQSLALCAMNKVKLQNYQREQDYLYLITTGLCAQLQSTEAALSHSEVDGAISALPPLSHHCHHHDMGSRTTKRHCNSCR
jgi:hypothetical protein